MAPVEYDPQAACPMWEAFLDRIMAGNQKLIRYLQKAAGYSLTGDVSEQAFFIPYGSGANGKSVFLTTLLAVLGDYGIQAPPDLLMVKQGERHPTELADLKGARLVVAIESEEGKRLAESLVKQLTGGDKIKARRMREDFWGFDATHKLWLATNHKPIIRGSDYAIWRRIRLIPFNVTIPPEEQDKQLPAKLQQELPGILRWAVEGCLVWQREGLGEPPEVRAATESYRAEMDVIATFLNGCCIVNPLAKAKVKDLYQAYVEWCKENNEYPLSQRVLGTRLLERGFKQRKGAKGQRFWLGIGLLEAAQVAQGGANSGINAYI
jgi:putative DNA primase/helicase